MSLAQHTVIMNRGLACVVSVSRALKGEHVSLASGDRTHRRPSRAWTSGTRAPLSSLIAVGRVRRMRRPLAFLAVHAAADPRVLVGDDIARSLELGDQHA